MNPIEKAIRNALEKGDASDKDFREKVYRAVHSAVEKGLSKNPDLAPEAARQRRDLLRLTISRVESEFIPAVEPVAREAQAPAPRVEPLSGPAPARERVEPSLDFAAGVSSERNDDPAAGIAVDADSRPPSRRRKGLAAIFLGVTVLAAVAIGVWWAAQTGLFLSPEERDTAVRSPPASFEDESYDPGVGPAEPGVTQARGDWISIFTPADPTLVTAPSGATAEVLNGDGGAVLRIRSGTSGTPVLIDVGEGILDRIAGRNALFDIVASAEEGQPTQISITCNFGELGDCGRNRYNVGIERGDFLFALEMPNKRPGAAGTIAISSDVGEEGRAVLVHEIKVSIAE